MKRHERRVVLENEGEESLPRPFKYLILSVRLINRDLFLEMVREHTNIVY